MACPYSREIENKAYKVTMKSIANGFVPEPIDERQRYIRVGCGRCSVCNKKNMLEWKIRLKEEAKFNHRKLHWVTFTVSDDSYLELMNVNRNWKLDGYEFENAIGKTALDRWWKKMRNNGIKGEELKYFFVSELGGNNTERIHWHGFVWVDMTREELMNSWDYGTVWSERQIKNINATIGYTVKYMFKEDKKHIGYKGTRKMSRGLGMGYVEKMMHYHKFNGKDTRINYLNKEEGKEYPMPYYMQRKFWTDEERRMLSSYNVGRVNINGQEYERDSLESVRALEDWKMSMAEMKLDTSKFDEDAYINRVNRKRYLKEKKAKKIKRYLSR